MIEKEKQGLRYQIGKIGKHGAVYGLGSISSRVVAFFLIPLYTHFLTPADYGVLQLIGITIEVMSVIIGLRLAVTVFRFYYEAEEDNTKKTVVSTALIGVLIMGTGLVAPILVIAPWMSSLILEGEQQAWLLRIALISLWFQLPISVVTSYIQVKEKSVFFVSVSLSRLLFSVLLNIYFVAIAKIGVLGILMSTLIVDVIAGSVLIPYCISLNGINLSWSWVKKMLRFSVPLIPGSLASMATHASDRYFIRGYLSLADTGIYSLGYKMGNSIHGLLYVPFSQIWNARRFAIEKDPDAKVIYAKICTYFISFMCFTGIGISLFATDIVALISPKEYGQAAHIIPLIVLCYIVYATEDHVSTGIWLSKKTERIASATIFAAVINLCMNFLLIPKFGMYGAVVSTLVTFVCRNAGLYLMANKLFPIPFEWGKLFGILFLCAILYMIGEQLSELNVYIRSIIKLGLWFSYLPVFLMIFLKKHERDKIMDSLGAAVVALLKRKGRSKNFV
jgi:O-antigen/teichoic acid export membrane protein